MAVIVPAAVIAAIGIGTAISGASKTAKANRMAQNNTRPDYKINPEEQSNLDIATSLAGKGLGDATKQFYLNSSQQGLDATIDAILKGGGDVNSIDKAYGAYNDSIGRLAVADDQAKVQNINMLIKQQERMSDQRDKAWQINKYAPFADKSAAIAEMKKAGETQMWQGIGQIGNAVGSGVSGYSQKRDIKLDTGDTGNTGTTKPGSNTNNDGLYANWGNTPGSGTSGGNNGVANNGNMGMRYNASTGTYVNSMNWNSMSPEQQLMLSNLWN